MTFHWSLKKFPWSNNWLKLILKSLGTSWFKRKVWIYHSAVIFSIIDSEELKRTKNCVCSIRRFVIVEKTEKNVLTRILLTCNCLLYIENSKRNVWYMHVYMNVQDKRATQQMKLVWIFRTRQSFPDGQVQLMKFSRGNLVDKVASESLQWQAGSCSWKTDKFFLWIQEVKNFEATEWKWFPTKSW